MIQNHLKVELAKRGMSMLELSRRLEEHYTTIRRFTDESRKTINVPLLERICAELGCQPGDIFTYEPQRSPQFEQ